MRELDFIEKNAEYYGYNYKFIEDNNELAAFLSRKIAEAHRSYAGVFNGRLSSLKIKADTKNPCLCLIKLQ